MIKPLCSYRSGLKTTRVFAKSNTQYGQAITEFIFTFPVVMMMGAGIIHFGLLANAKANLDYAATMAARIASTQENFGLSDDPGQSTLFREVLRRMHATDTDAYDADDGDTDMARIRICIESPSNEAFDDWANAEGIIPSHNLQFRDVSEGASSGVSIQDANVLKLRVAYLYDTGIPGLNIGDSQSGDYRGHGDAPLPLHVESVEFNSGDQPNYSHGMWVSTTVAMVMQVPAVRNGVTTPYLARIVDDELVCDNFPVGLGG